MADDAAALAAAVSSDPVTIEDRAGHSCAGGAHSYLPDGRVVCWVAPLPGAEPAGIQPAGAGVPTLRYAVDAELVDRAPPAHVAGRWGVTGDTFWRLWCATEVVAKIVDRPIITFVTGEPVRLSPHVVEGWRVHWLTVRADEVLVALGIGRAADAPADDATA